MDFGPNMIFITGQSQLSKGDAISTVYSIFSLGLIVDVETDTIVDASCTSAMELTKKFVQHLFVGRNIISDQSLLIEDIKKRFIGLSQKALITATKDVYNRYAMQSKTK